MELHTKIHIEGHSLNANGTLMHYADVTAFSIINDKFTRFHKHIGVVTSSAKCKFLAPILGYGFIECFAEITDCTPARITVKTLIKYRERKGQNGLMHLKELFILHVLTERQEKCINYQKRK